MEPFVGMIVGLAMFIVANAPMLTGIILPPVVQKLNRDVPNDNERFIVTILVCFLVALLIKWPELAAGSPEKFASTFSIIFLESQVIYRLYFRSSFWRAKQMEKMYDGERDDTSSLPLKP